MNVRIFLEIYGSKGNYLGHSCYANPWPFMPRVGDTFCLVGLSTDEFVDYCDPIYEWSDEAYVTKVHYDPSKSNDYVYISVRMVKG